MSSFLPQPLLPSPSTWKQGFSSDDKPQAPWPRIDRTSVRALIGISVLCIPFRVTPMGVKLPLLWITSLTSSTSMTNFKKYIIITYYNT